MPAFGRGGAGNIEAATHPSTILSSTNNNNNNNNSNNEGSSTNHSADLEKAQANAESYLSDRGHLASYAGTPHDSLHNQQYAHMGRGGAGNYYSPWELQMRGEFQGAGTSHVLGDGTPAPRSQETELQGSHTNKTHATASSSSSPSSSKTTTPPAADLERGGHVRAEADVGTTAAKSDVSKGYRGRGGAGNYSYGVSESEERAYRKRHEEEQRRKEQLREKVEKGVEEVLPMPQKARLGLARVSGAGEPY